MRRRIKLMWDYDCLPLWHLEGPIYAGMDRGALPLSVSTLTRLEAWAAIANAKLAEAGYPRDMKWSSTESRAFEIEGRELWRILQHELGQDYYVVYHSMAEGRVLLPDDETAA